MKTKNFRVGTCALVFLGFCAAGSLLATGETAKDPTPAEIRKSAERALGAIPVSDPGAVGLIQFQDLLSKSELSLIFKGGSLRSVTDPAAAMSVEEYWICPEKFADEITSLEEKLGKILGPNDTFEEEEAYEVFAKIDREVAAVLAKHPNRDGRAYADAVTKKVLRETLADHFKNTPPESSGLAASVLEGAFYEHKRVKSLLAQRAERCEVIELTYAKMREGQASAILSKNSVALAAPLTPEAARPLKAYFPNGPKMGGKDTKAREALPAPAESGAKGK